MPKEYRLQMFAYCGMPTTVTQGDKAEVRAAAARYLRRKRRDESPITILEPGKKWEIETPDDAGMIADDEGILEIQSRTVRP